MPDMDQNSVFTGFLRDGKRRIDLVLVINDDSNGKVEMFRVNFLNNIIKAGLDIELESGVKPEHQHLIFVKIHAPPNVIQEYGMYFDVRRYFKDSHAELMNVKNIFLGIIKERELIKAVRLHDPGPINYSTMERSIIVYRVLLMLPFGFHENYFGLDRLLKNQIILDAYPLHDGPYFFLDHQDKTVVNGRQVLFHTWQNLFKIIKGQPISLVNEYLGHKVAFYFAFFGFYVRGLFVTAVLSILMTIIAIAVGDKFNVTSLTCNPPDTLHSEVCSACTNERWCPVRPTKDYCFKAHLVHLSHSLPITLLCLIVGLWSIIFVTLWNRRKNYLYWLWEVDREDIENAVRSDYTIFGKNMAKKNNIVHNKTILQNIGIVMYNAAIFLLYFAFIFLVTIIIMLYRQWFFYLIFGTKQYGFFYLLLSLIGLLYLCFAKMMERINKIISFAITDYENQKTYASYERHYVWRFFVLNMLAYLYFYIHYVLYPVYSYEFRSMPGTDASFFEKIRYMNCGPYGCVDEIFILLLVAVLFKEFLFKLPMRLIVRRTDYNRGASENLHVPCWEKEYELKPLNENCLDDQYMNLILQFAFGTYFVQSFPLMPLLMFFINLWHLRCILTGYRRPLVLNISGIGAWGKIITVVGYSVPFINILSLAWGSQVVERWIYCCMQQDDSNPQSKHYVKLYNTFFRYTTTATSSDTCNFPIMLEKSLPLNRYWEPKRWKWWIIFYYEHFAILFALLLRWLLPPYSKDVKTTTIIERDIKHKYFISKGIHK